MTILILFHFSFFRDLKHFYLFVRSRMKSDFPHTVSYNRFVELERKVCIPLAVFLKMKALGQCTGISFIDSTPIRSCHIKREKQHKTFKEFARKGKSTLGWFYGFKLHLIINDKGELLDFLLTPGNVDDRAPLKHMDFHKRIFGKLFGDRGYISKDLFEQLFIDGVHLFTRLKKGMKNALMLQHDKIMLRKRSLIETVNDQLKNVCQIELDPPSMLPKLHHQSVIGFGCFLLFRQKAPHQHRRGVCTSLFPASCLGRTRVPLLILPRNDGQAAGLSRRFRLAPILEHKHIVIRIFFHGSI